MNRYITKEETQMSNKHMKRCSTSYTIMELQIKKKQADTTTCLSEWLTSKGLKTPNAGKDMNQQEVSFLGGGDAKWENHFGRQFASFLVNYTHSTLLVGM